ncbi:NADP-dependent oxidoreductase [Streptomyces sp. ISL-43]|uniref:NADP-dependent oxidoreductase n=1 Tax=Streptomyces sp. ISL-43 TaxID=2819183 RepID=UPI001BE7A9A7|nr:NADP-dependent oxidoreductase [Streptomyces sp. ISL-43]MBT2451648.1 NADP-dependent oxidoreductase [Streptomyces sp. ISL-43]
MRAIVVSQWGGPEALTETEMERPEPGVAEILVRVRAAGVNPVDWKTRASGGLISWGAVPVVGWDVSGTVEEVGPGVTLFQPGDEVFGMPRFPHQASAYAEYVTAPARHFVRKPANIDHIGAAALPLAALTAYQSLVDTAGLEAGQRVLIHAAAGGVGHLAVQIAKAYGAYVIGTASAGKHELLRSLGADELIDYRSADFAEAVGEDVDIVLDSVGGDYGQRSLAVLKPGGHLVTLPSPDDVPADAPGVHTGWTLVEPDYAGLKAVAALVAQGKLRPLAEAAKAHEIGERGRTTGKIVLTVA